MDVVDGGGRAGGEGRGGTVWEGRRGAGWRGCWWEGEEGELMEEEGQRCMSRTFCSFSRQFFHGYIFDIHQLSL